MRVTIDKDYEPYIREVMQQISVAEPRLAVNHIIAQSLMNSQTEQHRFWFMAVAISGMLASERENFPWEPQDLAARAQEIANESLKRFEQSRG